MAALVVVEAGGSPGNELVDTGTGRAAPAASPSGVVLDVNDLQPPRHSSEYCSSCDDAPIEVAGTQRDISSSTANRSEADVADVPNAAKHMRRLSTAATFKGKGAECAICFAPLPSGPVCVLIRKVYTKKRACRHFLHVDCAQLMIRTTPAPHCCPLCRAVFETTQAFPDVRLDSTAWFRTVDIEENGALQKAEVVDALTATLPVDPEKLDGLLAETLWQQWDTEGTGRITREAFEHPSRGLLQFVLYSLPSLRREAGEGNLSSLVPDFVSCREGWFRYWDENCAHVLEYFQCLRALVHTLRLEGAPEDARTLGSVLSSTWREYGLGDVETSDPEADPMQKPLTVSLFCERPDGFCDALVADLQKAFGVAKFRRMLDRAQLLQQPVAELKKELRKFKSTRALDCFEKTDMVEAILDARALAVDSDRLDPQGKPAAIPKPFSLDVTGQPPNAPSATAFKALPLKEIKQRLDTLGVSYGHCVERYELEALLADYLSRMPKQAPVDPRLWPGQSGARPSAASPDSVEPVRTDGSSDAENATRSSRLERTEDARSGSTRANPGVGVAARDIPEGRAPVSEATAPPTVRQVPNASAHLSSGRDVLVQEHSDSDVAPTEAASKPPKRCYPSSCVIG